MVGRKRDGLIIWVQHLKYVRALRRYGHLHYVSKRMKYAVLYCDNEKVEWTINELRQLKCVKNIERSHLQEIKTTYEKKKSKREEKEEAFIY